MFYTHTLKVIDVAIFHIVVIQRNIGNTCCIFIRHTATEESTSLVLFSHDTLHDTVQIMLQIGISIGSERITVCSIILVESIGIFPTIRHSVAISICNVDRSICGKCWPRTPVCRSVGWLRVILTVDYA